MKVLISSLIVGVVMLMSCMVTEPINNDTSVNDPGYALCDVTSSSFVKVFNEDGDHIGNVFPDSLMTEFCFDDSLNVIHVPLGETIFIDPVIGMNYLGLTPDGIYEEYSFVNGSTIPCTKMN